MNKAIAKIFGYLVAIISVLVFASLFLYAFGGYENGGKSPNDTMTGDVFWDVGLMLGAYILVIGFVCTVIAIKEHLERIEYILTALAQSHQEDEKSSEPFQ